MKIIKFIILGFLFLTLINCTSTKNIRMFQEMEDEYERYYKPILSPELTIKPHDNLYISIKTLDEEVNRIFDPSNTGGTGFSAGTASNFGDPASQYINGYQVSKDSTITLPVLGRINFVGLTLEEAKEKLKKRAEDYLREPSIEVKFLNYRVNVIGEVRSPGILYNYEGSINIFDAIGRANGITEYANLREVVVQRENKNGVYNRKIDLTGQNVYDSDVFYLQPGDLVYIPPDKLIRLGDNSDLYSRFLSTVSTLVVALAFVFRL